MKAFITKYALTVGIQEVDDAFTRTEFPNTISVPSLGVFATFHGSEWHRTLESAKSRAGDMKVKRIISLRKQIAKLEAMNFLI